MKRTLLVACCIILAAGHLWAQRSSLAKLRFDLDALAFFRNAEYIMPFTDGYSAITTRVAPHLRYQINDRASLEGGGVFGMTAGDSNKVHAFPWFAFEYHPSEATELTLGNIHGGQEHHLEAPLYNPERYFFTPLYHPEAGLQFRTNTSHWSSDTWIDWEHFLYPNTYDQERFFLATRQEFILLSKESRWQVELPTTACVAHRGGQFSTVDTNSGSLLNLHAGLRISSGTEKRYFMLYVPYYYYRNISGPDKRYNSPEPYHTPFLNGWGVHPQAEARFRLGERSKMRLNVGYWVAHNYLSPRGSLLFQSACGDSYTFVPQREMLTGDAAFEHTYKGVSLGIDFQLYYDQAFRKADYAYGIYLRWSLSHEDEGDSALKNANKGFYSNGRSI